MCSLSYDIKSGELSFALIPAVNIRHWEIKNYAYVRIPVNIDEGGRVKGLDTFN